MSQNHAQNLRGDLSPRNYGNPTRVTEKEFVTAISAAVPNPFPVPTVKLARAVTTGRNPGHDRRSAREIHQKICCETGPRPIPVAWFPSLPVRLVPSRQTGADQSGGPAGEERSAAEVARELRGRRADGTGNRVPDTSSTSHHVLASTRLREAAEQDEKSPLASTRLREAYGQGRQWDSLTPHQLHITAYPLPGFGRRWTEWTICHLINFTSQQLAWMPDP
ncbi:hypothetical protein Bbelb_095200 [Branchiostoma belcheri]|nr:hypothetical protein Bbelb_095200 [Branchiostoma belcheri]